MKKFIFVSILLFIASASCKKMNPDDGGACGCSPATKQDMYLVIRNSAGADLLNQSTAGYYPKDKIELYRKDAEGKSVPITFYITPPFSYGNEKFNLNQLYITDLALFIKTPDDALYLKLGDSSPFELKVSIVGGTVEKLLVDKKEAERDKPTANYVSLFYLSK